MRKLVFLLLLVATAPAAFGQYYSPVQSQPSQYGNRIEIGGVPDYNQLGQFVFDPQTGRTGIRRNSDGVFLVQWDATPRQVARRIDASIPDLERRLRELQGEVGNLNYQLQHTKQELALASRKLPIVVISNQAFEVTEKGNLVSLMPQQDMVALLERGQRNDPTRVVLYGQKGDGSFRLVSTSGATVPADEAVYHRGRKVRPVGELDGKRVFVYAD